VAAVLAILFAVPPAGVVAQNAPPHQTPGVAQTAPPITASDRFGLDVAWPAPSAAAARAQRTLVMTAGAGWAHLAVSWDAIEPARRKFAWGQLDAAVRETAGQRLLITIQRTPKWAALTPDAAEPIWSHEPPQSIADWSTFVRAIAGRYHGRVAAWQIEPPLEFSMYRGTTHDYLDMLHAARVEIRRADPEALVAAATPVGLDLPFIKLLYARAAGDFDALVLYPRGRTPGDLVEALSTLRDRKVLDARHQLWLSARTDWPQAAQLCATALALGVVREFWQAPARPVAAVLHTIGDTPFVGPLDRGPGVYAFVFANGERRTAVLWTDGEARTIPLATDGPPVVTGADGQPRPVAQAGTIPVDQELVFVSTPSPAVVEEAGRTLAAGPLRLPRDPARDFSRADNVSAALGAVNAERGLYNQRLRTLPSAAVVPVFVDGSEALRTDQTKDNVYVYFAIDSSYAFFVDGRYDYLITVEVHRAGAPQRVGFNLMYDSMSGYRFSPWQWVDAGDGWATYTTRITDASFSKTWGWDFAVNGAADKKENLIVRSVTVTRVPASTP
jgi:hypothetical protein